MSDSSESIFRPVSAEDTARLLNKRGRRTKQEMAEIRSFLYDVLEEDQPMTVRQVFYRATSAGVVRKTEQEYGGTIGRLLGEMRLDGTIPFYWIADNTRWMRKPTTYSDLADYASAVASFYRRSLWDEQDAYIEIWLEKDALAGVLQPVTARWDVPLMVTRGYASLSFLYSAAETIGYVRKPTYLYYFGDYDPSGVDIPRSVEARLREFAPNADITFERVAVNPDQIEEWELQTRPTKKTDTRSKNFEGESVEVDAIPAPQLRELVEDCIKAHVDQHQLEITRRAEKEEKQLLRQWGRNFGA